jgi:hypothetical protein
MCWEHVTRAAGKTIQMELPGKVGERPNWWSQAGAGQLFQVGLEEWLVVGVLPD